jgi:hypothetical protein
MPRGGRRNGKPGKAYGSRTDLNDLKSQQYGDGVRRAESLAAVPVRNKAQIEARERSATPVGGITFDDGRVDTTGVSFAPGVRSAPHQAAPGPDPGTLGGLLDPTARPDEPLTAGNPLGAGPGPEVMNQASGDQDLDNLRAIFKAHPSLALLDLIQEMEG